MLKDIIEIKQGIKVHLVENNLFKTNIVCVLLTVPLLKENVTQNALIPFCLRSGTKNLPSQIQINKKLEEMYGASFDCGIDKMGDNQVLKFYIESINDHYTDKREDILKKTIDLLLEIVFDTNIKESSFDEAIFNIEKQNLKQVIEGKIDDKDLYAFEQCINSMYGENGFGIYKYGKIDDLNNFDAKKLAEHYIRLIQTAKIDIFVSGELENENVKDILNNNENIKKLVPRAENYILNNEYTECKQKVDKPQEKQENIDISQGKLVIGLDIFSKQENLQCIAIVYNAILGDGANSMLFQNVREKASLAYSAKSKYVKQKGNIFIRCGIEIQNYQKAIDIIKEQLENIKKGNFTDEDIENAKCYLISGIKMIEEEQDSEVVFYIGGEISKTYTSLEEYIKKINSVKKEDIIEFANKTELNTIYFLTKN